MKQWLIENKSGMYSKINEINPALLGVGQEKADDEMHQQDDQNATMVNNVSMGLEEGRGFETTVEIEDQDFIILGKEYMVSGEADVEWHSEAADVDDQGYTTSTGGDYIDNVTIKIKELFIENGDEYRQVQDPVAIKTIEDLLNTDPKLNRELGNVVVDKIDFGDYEDNESDYEPDMDEQIGVGYVMKTKSPEDKPYFPGN